MHDKNWKMKMNEYRIKEKENRWVNDKKIKIILGLKKIDELKLFLKKRNKSQKNGRILQINKCSKKKCFISKMNVLSNRKLMKNVYLICNF